jgi:Mrp family chromosome partitioning ATPase
MSLRRNWFWLAALAASAAVAVTWIGFRERPLYQAESTIELAQSADASMESQLRLLRSDNLLAKAAAKAHTSLEAARGHLTIRRAGLSQSIEIEARAYDPKDAADLASAVVGAYTDELRTRDAAAAAQQRTQVSTLRSQLDMYESKLFEFESGIVPVPGSERKQRYDALLQETNAIQASYDELRHRQAPQTAIRVVERPHAAAETANPNPWRDLGFGAVMLLGGGVLFFVSRKRVHSLAKAVFKQNIQVPFKMQTGTSGGGRIIALSNAGAGPASPETLLDFVESLVSPGHTVLVVDCEVSATLSESAGLKGAHGLSDFLTGNHKTSDVPMPVWKSNRQGVFIMPAGTRPSRIPALLAKSTAGDALASLGAKYAHVVINAPSILTAGEMRDLTPQIDGILLVTPVERSAGLTDEAVRQVEEYGGKVLGLVEDSPQFAAV